MLLKQQTRANEHIGFLIAAARRRINQAVGGRLRRYQLGPRQFWILVTIHEHPGFSLGELALHLRMDDPTASRVVLALRRRGLLEVRSDERDRRRSLLYLGPRGRKLGGRLRALAVALRGAVVGDLSEAEQQALRVSLHRVIASMDRFQEENGAAQAAEARR
jgi:MarR family transcriptional regulator, organic hydroperoxide resistance regulator